MDGETGTSSDAGFYFKCADPRLAWAGVIAGIVGLAALFFLGWTQIEAGPVSATERRTDPSSALATAPQVATQAETAEELRRRGLELLRTDFPEDQPSPPLTRADRLELHEATIEPVVRVATADDNFIAAPPPLRSKPAEAKVSKSAKAKDQHAAERHVRRHAHQASRANRDRVRMAHAKYVQARRESQTPSAAIPQTEQGPPEESKAFGLIAPWSTWKDGWDKLWSKGSGG